ncbi:formylmethanofuran dehydrogenase [Methanolobus sp. ZRKC3]|uniref:GltB/FmdC/FwdC-like GXGXG domain-containing protein n=1 Tax=Methanolobus sp. ZRKC3 TaxID=3125786 RepID=UPI00324CF33A
MPVDIELRDVADHICDYTFNFYWHEHALDPDSVIPSQKGTEYTYRDLVNALKKGDTVRIKGNMGKNFAYSVGADIQHLGGSGDVEKAGRIFVDGDVGPEAAMGMVSGTLYVAGKIAQPWGNIVEMASDMESYRKFRSITDIVHNGLGNDSLLVNKYNEKERTLEIDDGILRGTIAARCNKFFRITVQGDVHNGTGVLMQDGTVIVNGNAGMNTGSHLDGATVVINGNVGEFAGAFMKSGTLVFLAAKGYIGAEMIGGTIYSKDKVKANPPVEKSKMKGEDSALIRKLMDAGRVESMLYNKYEIGEEKEKYVEVRMRDGSVIMRKID